MFIYCNVNMFGIKSTDPSKLLLLAAYWWHLSLIQRNLALTYYSRTAMPSYLRDDDNPRNNFRHLIMGTGEAFLFTIIIRETIRFFNSFENDGDQSKDHDNSTGNSRQDFMNEFMNANIFNSFNGMSGEAGLPHFI